MKIVDAKTFLTLPNGTIFTKYNEYGNSGFSDICIKTETLVAANENLQGDFCYISSIHNLSHANLNAIIHDNEERYLDFTSNGRDGCFDEKQLFAVFHKYDVEGLLKLLQQSLKSYQ